jgi:thiosulfate/3-mercaptopyruvate sulfurtransferase
VSSPPTLPGIIVPPTWLAERLGDPGLRVLDMRDADAYAQAHVPGAVRLDLSRLGTKDGTRDNVLLDPEAFEELMQSLGVHDADTVVAYDDQWGLAAARLVWALHYYGHPAAGVLDGGWDRWTDEGRPAADGESSPPRGGFSAVPTVELGVELTWLEERVGSGELTLVDTRTTAEYDRGHVPGAKSWDWFNAVPPGSWDVTREVEELRVEWGALGVEDGKEIVVYCRSGMRAAHTWVAFKNAGFARVRLYDGSWQEWSAMKGPES